MDQAKQRVAEEVVEALEEAGIHQAVAQIAREAGITPPRLTLHPTGRRILRLSAEEAEHTLEIGGGCLVEAGEHPNEKHQRFLQRARLLGGDTSPEAETVFRIARELVIDINLLMTGKSRRRFRGDAPRDLLRSLYAKVDMGPVRDRLAAALRVYAAQAAQTSTSQPAS